MSTFSLVSLATVLVATAGCTAPTVNDDDTPGQEGTNAELSAMKTLDPRSFSTKVGCGIALGNGYYEQACNGYISSSFSIASAGSAHIAVQAYGSNFAGWPIMQVSVDGAVLSTSTVSSPGASTFGVDRSLSAGSHTIKIAFTNDAAGANGDRNLFIGPVSITNSPTSTTTSGVTLSPLARTGGTPTSYTSCIVIAWNKSWEVISPVQDHANASWSAMQSDAVQLEESLLVTQSGNAISYFACDGSFEGEYAGVTQAVCPTSMTSAQCQTFLDDFPN